MGGKKYVEKGIAKKAGRNAGGNTGTDKSSDCACREGVCGREYQCEDLHHE